MVFEMYDFVFQMCVNKGVEICVNGLLCVSKRMEEWSYVNGVSNVCENSGVKTMV